MKIGKKLILIFLIIAIIGCFKKKNIIPQNSEEVNFIVISSGAHSGYSEESYLVIKDGDDFKKLWNKVNSTIIPQPSVPEIDFSKYMVVAVFMGTCPTGGYSISIRSIRESEENIYVEVEKIKPGKDCILTQVLTQPFQIVKIKRSDKKVIFVKNTTVKNCT